MSPSGVISGPVDALKARGRAIALAAALAAAVSIVLSLTWADDAWSATSPAWGIESFAYPQVFSVEGNKACLEAAETVRYEHCDTYEVTATDIGSAIIKSGSMVLTDSPPAGVAVRGVALVVEKNNGVSSENLAQAIIGGVGGVKACSTVPVRCEVTTGLLQKQSLNGEPHKAGLLPDESLKMFVSVTVDEPPPVEPLINSAEVSGGIKAGEGVLRAAPVSRSNPVAPALAVFGASVFDASLLGEDGLPDNQAGSHPYEFSTRIGLNTVVRQMPEAVRAATTVEDLRDVVVDLPVGMAGSGVMAPPCPLAKLATQGGEPGPLEPKPEVRSGCPPETAVGRIRSYPESLGAAIGSVFNILPEKGHAAELGFADATHGTHVLYVTVAPTPQGYVVRTTSHEVPAIALQEILVDVFGDPAARDEKAKEKPVATFTNPEYCPPPAEQHPTVVMHMDSWQKPGSYNPDGTPNFEDPNWVKATATLPPVIGCENLKGLFAPEIHATLSSHSTDNPSGLSVDLTVPQHNEVEGLATPPLRDTTIVLPAGLTVNPSSANGLAACSMAQIGINANREPDAKPPACPEASKIGTVTLETPALAMEVCKKGEFPVKECPLGPHGESQVEKAPLKGSVYLARQEENPFKSLIAIYIVVDDPRTGVIAKIPAEVKLNEETGQLTTTVENTPQFPFSILHTEFFKGSTAALTTPMTCGAYTLTSELTPWSAPQSGPPATPSAELPVSEGPGGGACLSPGFAPGFRTGVDNTQAGAHSPLSVTFARQDGEQSLKSTSVTTAPGLLGTIRGIPRCEEPQATQGTCGAESLLGEATVGVGSGSTPFWVHGAKVYLTGEYNNGPFGLSIVVPTTAGPFTLEGNAGFGKEVVRASIRIDPRTAQITVVSDPFPLKLKGIPLEIKAVNVTINRANFTFNPTNCGKLESTATFTSSQGATSTASSPFYASHCQSLAFHPTLTAESKAQTSKNEGASLTVKVTATPGQANIAKTDLTIPAQLPSRLSTLQKACLAAVFNANPASCPPESNIGTATVQTPVLNSALSGPIYLVSFGGGEFPHTEIVLQGEGITTVLDGHTDIKHSITYSNFESVPDVPFTSFQANLPAGLHSILGAVLPESLNRNLCGTHYTIPAVLVAQSGLQIKQATPVHVTGCPSVPTIRAATVHKHTVTILLYTPASGTIKITGKGVKAQTIHAAQENNESVTLHLAAHHPRTATLALTETSSHQRHTTYAKTRL